MPVGWFLVPYKRRAGEPVRYCAMDDFTATIYTIDGGAWSECECLGNHAVVKVRASLATLTLIAGTAGFRQLPPRFVRLADSLSDLSSSERDTLNQALLNLGYTQAEIDAALGNTLRKWQAKTLGDLLRLALTRRLKPRYDAATDTIVLDGPEQPTRPAGDADRDVTDG